MKPADDAPAETRRKAAPARPCCRWRWPTPAFPPACLPRSSCAPCSKACSSSRGVHWSSPSCAACCWWRIAGCATPSPRSKWSCERDGRGLRVLRTADAVQFVSAPENARFVAALLGLPTQAKLTTAALETLAVVAYRQPITRSQIEFIRGVNSDRALASLLQYGLVLEVGRAATVGRPALFGTTAEFLQQFGLGSLDALPRPESPELAAIERQIAEAAARVREAVGGDEGEAAPHARS